MIQSRTLRARPVQVGMTASRSRVGSRLPVRSSLPRPRTPCNRISAPHALLPADRFGTDAGPPRCCAARLRDRDGNPPPIAAEARPRRLPAEGIWGRPDQCQPSGAPRPWTPPLPWTPRASTEVGKPQGPQFPTAPTAIILDPHHDLETRSLNSSAPTWCRGIRRFDERWHRSRIPIYGLPGRDEPPASRSARAQQLVCRFVGVQRSRYPIGPRRAPSRSRSAPSTAGPVCPGREATLPPPLRPTRNNALRRAHRVDAAVDQCGESSVDEDLVVIGHRRLHSVATDRDDAASIRGRETEAVQEDTRERYALGGCPKLGPPLCLRAPATSNGPRAPSCLRRCRRRTSASRSECPTEL